MNKYIDKKVVGFTILVSVFLLIVIWSFNQLGNQYPAYSILNKSEKGYSIFYQILKEHNYPVKRTLEPIPAHETGNIQLITIRSLESNLENNPGIKDWVKEGGIIIALIPKGNQPDGIEKVFEEEIQLKVKQQGKGVIIKVNSSIIINSNLLDKTDGAYKLLTEIEKYNYDTIYFNEHNLFAARSSKTLWDVIPLGVKVILYQLIIVLIAFFIIRVSVLEKPVPSILK